MAFYAVKFTGTLHQQTDPEEQVTLTKQLEVTRQFDVPSSSIGSAVVVLCDSLSSQYGVELQVISIEETAPDTPDVTKVDVLPEEDSE